MTRPATSLNRYTPGAAGMDPLGGRWRVLDSVMSSILPDRGNRGGLCEQVGAADARDPLGLLLAPPLHRAVVAGEQNRGDGPPAKGLRTGVVRILQAARRVRFG